MAKPILSVEECVAELGGLEMDVRGYRICRIVNGRIRVMVSESGDVDDVIATVAGWQDVGIWKVQCTEATTMAEWAWTRTFRVGDEDGGGKDAGGDEVKRELAFSMAECTRGWRVLFEEQRALMGALATTAEKLMSSAISMQEKTSVATSGVVAAVEKTVEHLVKVIDKSAEIHDSALGEKELAQALQAEVLNNEGDFWSEFGKEFAKQVAPRVANVVGTAVEKIAFDLAKPTETPTLPSGTNSSDGGMFGD